MNLVYITNRVLVTKEDSKDILEYNETLHSLNNQYGKYLKVFYLFIRTTVGNPYQNVQNTLSSLPYLMPPLKETYNFLINAKSWLRQSAKNVILLKFHDKSKHLLELFIRFIIFDEEENDKLFELHDISALLFYEKLNLKTFIIPSLKRYVAIVSKLFPGNIPYQLNSKTLHTIIIRTEPISGIKKDEPNDRIQYYTSNEDEIQSMIITIYQNFHLIHTSYEIRLNEKKETDTMIFVVDPVLPINGDILIVGIGSTKSGSQFIYFRLQFHTCSIFGDYIILKNTDLDINENWELKKIRLLELCFKHQVGINKEHEKYLLRKKYFVRNNNIGTRDIFSQLKLLDIPKIVSNYKAGPVDGNLYTRIPKPKKSVERKSTTRPKESGRSTKKSKEITKDQSLVLHQFNMLEKEISNAIKLLPQIETNKKAKMTADFSKNLIYEDIYETSKNLAVEKNVKLYEHRISKEYSSIYLDENQNSFKEMNNNYQKQNFDFNNYYNNYNYSIYDTLSIERKVAIQLNNPNTVEKSHFISTFNYSEEITKRGQNVSSKDDYSLKLSLIRNASNLQHVWYRSKFTRENAILYLINKPMGYFIIRPSTSLWKSLSIALKCNVNDSVNAIQHFIIDLSTEGYRIRGFINEKFYRSLNALVEDHIEDKIGLPCKLILPYENEEIIDDNCFNGFLCDESFI